MTALGSDAPILVAGGGIGGFAVALALLRTGRSVQLIEQATSLGEIGAGIQLGPNAFRALGALGVDAAVKDLAVLPDSTIMLDVVTDEEVARIPYGEAFVARFGHPYAVAHRADLHAVLVDACRTHGTFSLRTSTKLASMENGPDAVSVATADGRRIEAPALVGADGLWSVVRRNILDDGDPRVSGHVAYRAMLPADQVPEHLRIRSIRFWGGEKTHLVCYPLRGGTHYNLVAVFHSARFTEGWDTFGEADELRQRFDGACDDVRLLLGKIESWRMWVLFDREPVRHWSSGRMTLLGDAAHPMLQYLGQGATMALEDAVCLARQVEAHGTDYAAAFRAYEELRYLRTGRAQMMSRLYGEVFHASGVVREIRNRAFANQSPQQAYASMSWMYDFDVCA